MRSGDLEINRYFGKSCAARGDQPQDLAAPSAASGKPRHPEGRQMLPAQRFQFTPAVAANAIRSYLVASYQ
jgi:hypothetical protein